MPNRSTQPSLRELQQKYASHEVPVSAEVLRKLQRDTRTGARRLYRTLFRRFEEQKKERNRLNTMLHFERLLWKAGILHVAGVDEVGVGPLAGPVVAAAVVFPPWTEIPGVNDSKILDEEKRVALEKEVRRRAAAVAIGVVEVEEIDRINIYHAGVRAMQVALSNLDLIPQHILVDSRTIPDLVQPQNNFNKGDGINFSIAAASIVAKVYRDRLMTELDAVYPGYGFRNHKGYATAGHQRAIREKGPCQIHRRSYDFIREICGEYSELYYALKQQGLKITSQSGLRSWESAVREAASDLSEMENKKLRLMANRLWKKINPPVD